MRHLLILTISEASRGGELAISCFKGIIKANTFVFLSKFLRYDSNLKIGTIISLSSFAMLIFNRGYLTQSNI
jgi:hypothetical protein